MTPSMPLFKKAKTFPLANIVKFKACIFVYKSKNNLIPQSFPILVRNIHAARSNLNTRSTLDIYPEVSPPTNFQERSIRYRGPKEWNSLPLDIIKTDKIKSFQKILKDYLLKNI